MLFNLQKGGCSVVYRERMRENQVHKHVHSSRDNNSQSAFCKPRNTSHYRHITERKMCPVSVRPCFYTSNIVYVNLSLCLFLASSLPLFSVPLSLSLSSLTTSLSLCLYLLCSWWVLVSTPLHYDIMFAALSTAECLNVSYIVAAHSSQPYNTANANSLSA